MDVVKRKQKYNWRVIGTEKQVTNKFWLENKKDLETWTRVKKQEQKRMSSGIVT